jgi:hypothetical protein
MGTDERMPIVDFGFLIGENGQIGVDEAVGEWMVKVWAKGGEVALSWELLDHLIRAAPPAVVPYLYFGFSGRRLMLHLDKPEVGLGRRGGQLESTTKAIILRDPAIIESLRIFDLEPLWF